MRAQKSNESKPILYLGERLGPFGIFQYFRDSTGKTYAFSRIRNVYFGECYKMLSEGKLHVRPDRVEAKLSPTAKEREKYEAAKLAVKAFRLTRRKAMQLKKPHPDIVKAIQLLKPFYRSLDLFEASRFMDYLANELSRRKK